MASSAAAIDWTGFGALASSIPNKKDFPIIVIGAGLGGLVSAAYLSKYGFEVTLPAKNPEGVKKELSKVFPHEKQGIHHFYTEMEQVISELWEGKQYYKARSQDLSDTLADCIEQNNGKIHYNTEAAHILFNHKNNIEGVMDHTGKKYPAKAVIANCSVPALFNKMIPKKQVPPDLTRQIQKRNTSLSSFVVWLGLNKGIDHIKEYEIDLALSTNINDDPLFSKKDLAKSGIGVTLYDNLFKGYSIPGKSTL